MLKAFIPVCVLILGIFIGIDNPSRIQLAIVSMISTGVFISSYGELLFSLTGFLFQLGAIFAESSRLVLSDRLLKDLKLDALSMVYYQSPVCFLFISVAFILFELDRFPITIFMDKFLLGMLLLSGIAAFGLNIAVVLLITHSSALTMTLGGIAKDILLVILSMIIFLSPVTPTQMFGYSISLSGMNLYKNFKSDPAGFSDSTMRYLYYILPCLKARPEIAQVSGGKEANDIADQEAGTLLTQIKSKD